MKTYSPASRRESNLRETPGTHCALWGHRLLIGGLFLASAALVPTAGAQAPVAPAPGASSLNVTAPASTIAQVNISGNGDKTTVQVQGRGAELSYHVTRMSDPPRVVVDFDDARLSVAHNAVASDYRPVQRVRFGQSRPGQVRMVIDLAHAADFTVDRSGSGLTVTFASELADASAPAKVQAAAAPVATPRVPNSWHASSSPEVSATAFPLPASLTGTTSALASPVPQNQEAGKVSTQLEQNSGANSGVDTSRPDSLMPPSVPASMPVTPGSSELQLMSAQPKAPQAQVRNAVAASSPVYSGEPISVDLKDLDLKDFFRLVHEISGLNVVLDPMVRGNVTLELENVPWDQALDIVLKNNNLSKELDGNVLRIATQATLKQEANDRRDLLKAQSDSVAPVTITRVLSYAKAMDLQTALKRFISSRGDVTAISASNTLIIRDIPDNIPQIDNLIRQLDQKTKQVQIEARVVEADRTFARDIGSQFGISLGQAGPQSINVGGGAPTTNFASPIQHTGGPVPPLVIASSSGGSSNTNQIPLMSNLPAVAPTSGFAFTHASPNFALDYILTAMETKGVGKLLSAPQLTAQNNFQATVKQGEEIPIQTTVNNTVSVQYVDAVLKMQVTPQITADGTVVMDVLVENTAVDNGQPLVQGIPALSTQSAQTKVTTKDGETTVIGGVMVNTQQTSINQVPLIGSVPIIGHLFRETSVTVGSKELLFFLTPRILPG